jgi:hypothetical protein
VRNSTPADPWRCRSARFGVIEESPLDYII